MDCAAGPFLGSLRYPSGINPSLQMLDTSTFLQAKKNPPKRVFPKTIIDSLSAAILAMVDHP